MEAFGFSIPGRTCRNSAKSHRDSFPTPSNDFIDLISAKKVSLRLKCLIAFNLTEYSRLLPWNSFCLQFREESPLMIQKACVS